MDFIAWAWTLVLGRLQSVFGVDSPYGPVALGGALVFAILFYVDARGKRGRPISLAGFFKSIFPRRLIWHPSSRLDMRLWFVNTVAFASAYGMLVLGGLFWRNMTLAVLTDAFGAAGESGWPTWAILTIATLAELLAYEFGYWLSHYLFHAIPALWEFHKVHHSAEVLTTLTEMRTHPVEIIAFMNVIGLFIGVAFGVLTYVFGPGAHPLTLMNANVVLMLFIVTIGHLRHSHMWIAFTGLAGRLFQSPAHHQIHHSDQPRHFNKNLGFALAIWDWLFGTLYVPEQYEKITFGVGAEHVRFDTVVKTFALPFRYSADQLLGAASRLKARLRKPEAASLRTSEAPPSPARDGIKA
jgi:sterol desaturase/sphingolipid hydroxylase (fatty acid hydroxylase superfamily)